jgi:hypothetical protein
MTLMLGIKAIMGTIRWLEAEGFEDQKREAGRPARASDPDKYFGIAARESERP